MSSSWQADGERVELGLPGKGNSMSEVRKSRNSRYSSTEVDEMRLDEQ